MNQQSGSLFIGFSGKAITSGRISPHPLMFVLCHCSASKQSMLLTAYIGSLLLSPFKKNGISLHGTRCLISAQVLSTYLFQY